MHAYYSPMWQFAEKSVQTAFQISFCSTNAERCSVDVSTKTKQLRLLARDVNERNSVLTNRNSLVYMLQFVSAVTR